LPTNVRFQLPAAFIAIAFFGCGSSIVPGPIPIKDPVPLHPAPPSDPCSDLTTEAECIADVTDSCRWDPAPVCYGCPPAGICRRGSSQTGSEHILVEGEEWSFQFGVTEAGIFRVAMTGTGNVD